MKHTFATYPIYSCTHTNTDAHMHTHQFAKSVCQNERVELDRVPYIESNSAHNALL